MSDYDFAETRGKQIILNTKVLRSKAVTELNLGKDGLFASVDHTSIIRHEYGHVLENVYGINGLDIVKETLENLGYKIDVINYLRSSISEASVFYTTKGRGRRRVTSYHEVTSEILSKHHSAPTEYTKTMI